MEAENAELRSENAKLRSENTALLAEIELLKAAQACAKTSGTSAAGAPQEDGLVKREPVVVQADNLRAMVTQIVAAAGSSGDEAKKVAANLVLSNLKGHDSHGVGYLPRYIRGVQAGLLTPDTKIKVVTETPTMLLLDGGIGFGQTIGEHAMALGIPKALEHGVAVVGIRNSHHLARIGAWAEQCADAGLISVHFTNVAGHDPLVAPHNGADARLGTNPFAVGFPGKGGEHIVLDYATSELALGKVREAMARGEPVKDGVLLDKHGKATNDPREQANGGSLLPFADHKGYSLALMCELIGGALTGGLTILPNYPRHADRIVNSMTSLIFSPTKLTGDNGLATIHDEAKRLFDYVTASPLRDDSKPVLVPGQIERRTLAKRSAEGIPVAAGTYDELIKSAVLVGISEDAAHATMKGSK